MENDLSEEDFNKARMALQKANVPGDMFMIVNTDEWSPEQWKLQDDGRQAVNDWRYNREGLYGYDRNLLGMDITWIRCLASGWELRFKILSGKLMFWCLDCEIAFESEEEIPCCPCCGSSWRIEDF